MERYTENAKWLLLLAPFRALSISAAYLTPFFLQNGLNLSQVFLLQSIFSVAFLLWELPSGYIADKFGRAFSIKISAPVAAVSMIAYGFSHQYWQFVICELILALANGLISGIDTALLLDSLKAQQREKEFVKISQRINAFGFAATALGVPIAIVLVKYVSISSTLVADGLLTGVGAFFALKLVEAPRFNGSQEAIRLSAWHAMRQLVANVEARWLVLLGAVLNAATYLAFWLSAPYYTKLGIPVIWFSAILAVRSLWKAWLSRRFTQDRHVERNMAVYVGLAGLSYLLMATGQLWLIWAVLGHDIVQALQGQPITAQLNKHMDHEFRATLNSLVNLVQRLLYSSTGPLLGLLVDRTNLATGFVVTGVLASAVASIALLRLHHLKTFQEKG
jgi:MFS family permease